MKVTSANVTYFDIYDKQGDLIATHCQHHYCKNTISEKLNSYVPSEDFTICVRWPDEEEAEQILFEGSLFDYLHKTKRH